jgi:hypothetical protein
LQCFDGVLGFGRNQDCGKRRGQVRRARRLDLDNPLAAHAIDPQTMGIQRVDMLAPPVHEQHIMAGLRHVGASKPANCTGAKDRECHD